MSVLIPVYRHNKAHSNGRRARATATFVGYAIVDDDMQFLLEYHWTVFSGYSCTSSNSISIFMHHLIIGRCKGLDVSHENADKFDNRRDNLRHTTRSSNMLNVADGPRKQNKSSKIRGVTIDRTTGTPNKWRGKIQVEGKWYQTKRCYTALEAESELTVLRMKVLAIVAASPTPALTPEVEE